MPLRRPANGSDGYAGVFIGNGWTDNRIVDVDGFSNWGSPGWTTDYDEDGFIGGALIGKRFAVGGMPLRVELSGTFGDLSGETNQLDPEGLDETARTEFRWVAAARVGIGQSLGPARVFATAGLAAAGLDNSVTDLDRSGLNDPWHLDPDDSFRRQCNSRRLDRLTRRGNPIGQRLAAAARRRPLRLRIQHPRSEPLRQRPLRTGQPAKALPLQDRKQAQHPPLGPHPPVRFALRLPSPKPSRSPIPATLGSVTAHPPSGCALR